MPSTKSKNNAPKAVKKSKEKLVPVEKLKEAVQEIAEKPAELQPGQIQVNIDLIRNFKPHLAMPCYGGQLTESTFMSYVQWANVAKNLGIDWTLETMVNESLINRARNTLTAKFLDMPEATHLMFIDADIGWEPWHLLVLLNRNVDVIGGLYPMKSLPIKWVVNGFEGAEEGPDSLQEVSKTGTGFMLIKKEVFAKHVAHPAVKPYKNDIGLDPKFDKHLRTYFDTAIRQNRLYSEDWTFCENHRDLGGKIYVDKRVLLKHTGSFVYSQENQDRLLKEFGEIHVNNLKAQGVKLVDKDGKEL